MPGALEERKLLSSNLVHLGTQSPSIPGEERVDGVSKDITKCRTDSFRQVLRCFGRANREENRQRDNFFNVLHVDTYIIIFGAQGSFYSVRDWMGGHVPPEVCVCACVCVAMIELSKLGGIFARGADLRGPGLSLWVTRARTLRGTKYRSVNPRKICTQRPA